MGGRGSKKLIKKQTSFMDGPLVSAICWSAIMWNFFVQIPYVIRYTAAGLYFKTIHYMKIYLKARPFYDDLSMIKLFGVIFI